MVGVAAGVLIVLIVLIWPATGLARLPGPDPAIVTVAARLAAENAPAW